MNQLTGQQPLTNYQMLSIHHKSSDNSDNSPIIIVRISSRLLTTLNPARLHSLKIGYNLFQSLVDENLSLQIPLKCKSDVEEGVEPFNRVVQNAARTATLVYMRKIHSSPCNPETKRKIN